MIAQELKSVYPQAVSTHTDIVPDIYKQAYIREGYINLPNDLQVGDKVKLIFASGEELLTVNQANAKGFKVASNKTGKVFVYGREVPDFHTVDYEALSTLNISATQALFRRVEMLEKENRQLKELTQQLLEMKQLLQENSLKSQK